MICLGWAADAVAAVTAMSLADAAAAPAAFLGMERILRTSGDHVSYMAKASIRSRII